MKRPRLHSLRLPKTLAVWFVLSIFPWWSFADNVDLLFEHEFGSERKDIGNEIIYQILIDRFANGNSANDCFEEKNFCTYPALRNKEDRWYRFQGGDLRGVINKLPYLSQLGATRLWLTPIFENLEVTTYNGTPNSQSLEVTPYHGYWVSDWYRLNRFFTDRGIEDYDIVTELAEKAWDYGNMRLMIDTVMNHTSPLNPTEWSLRHVEQQHEVVRSKFSPQALDLRAALFRRGKFITSPQLERERRANESGYIPMFHLHDQNIGEVNGQADWSDPYVLENYNLANLADLNQDHSYIFSMFSDVHSFWTKLIPHVAGYRVDAIKHVPFRFWQGFSTDLLRKFPHQELVGEYFGGGGSVPSAIDFYERTPMSMFDFDFRIALIDVFLYNGSFSKITDVWQNDINLGDASAMVTFIDSHDFPRLRGMGVSPERMRLAMILWMTSRGIPALYYGIEQDLFTPHDTGDPYNRPMMKKFDTQSEYFVLLKKLISIRRQNQSLRYGKTHVVHMTENIFAYERLLPNEKVFVALSKNKRTGSDIFTIKGLNFTNGVYSDVLSGKQYKVTNGEVNVSMAYGDAIVFSSPEF